MSCVSPLLIAAVVLLHHSPNFRCGSSFSEAGNCKQLISSATVENSWQSSSFLEAPECFKRRSGYRQGAIEFFHTKNGSQFLDHGYHWLVIQLTRPVVMTSVTIVTNQNLIERAIGIEVWTADSVIDFGADHCNAKTIGLKFNITASSWKKCGVTSMSKSGFEMTVLCRDFWSKSTQMMLMRKPDSPERHPMNFVNLWIGLTDAKIRFDPPSPVLVATFNQSVLNVTCSEACGQALTVCHPDESCAEAGAIVKPTVKIGDSGRYTCNLRGISVTEGQLLVWYPPDSIVVEQRRQSKVVAGYLIVEFVLVTSISQPRKPTHTCVLIIDDPGVLIHRCIAVRGASSFKVIREGCSNFNNGETRESTSSHWIVSLPLRALLSVIPVACRANATSDRRDGSGEISWIKSVNYTLAIDRSSDMPGLRSTGNGGLKLSERLAAGMPTITIAACVAMTLVLIAVTAFAFLRKRQRHLTRDTVTNSRPCSPGSWSRRGSALSLHSEASQMVLVLSERTCTYHGDAIRTSQQLRRGTAGVYANLHPPVAEEDNIYDRLMTIAPAT